VIKCTLCGAPIGDDGRVYHEVVGFERDRKQGGTNALRCRRRTGRVAHPFCVDREAHQIGATQGSLL
jgi:hypothetical protein